MPSLLELVIYDLIILLMKVYSILLNCSASLLASIFTFTSLNAFAANNGVGIPTDRSNLFEMESEMPPPANLQIVNLFPLEYNGGVHIRCNGQNTGRATVEVQGGVAPYTYQWSGLPSQTGATAYGMTAGTYTVTVTDAIGNSVSGSVTLIENPPLEAIPNVSPILCNGGVATVTLSAAGGTAPYSGLSWYQVPAGYYSYTVADANGCRKKVWVDITEPPALVATSYAASILCNGGTAEVVVEASGGVGPYNGTGIFNESAGTSSYTITDGNGCYGYTNVTITEPPVLSTTISNTDVLCRGGQSQITVGATGGTAPYVGTGVFTEYAGTYQYTITDANGCQNTASVSITQPSALVANISSTPILCNGDLSAVEIVATGGTAPYSGTGMFYEPAGLHNYTVVDNNGCSVNLGTMIVQPREIEVAANWTQGQGEGSPAVVEIIAAGGTPSYSGTGTFQQSAGTYTYMVYDMNGCSGSATVTIPAYGSGNMPTAILPLESGSLKTPSSFVQATYNTQANKSEITFQLEYDSDIQIEIYDLAGALVQTVRQEEALSGQNYLLSIDSDELSTGVYVYHFHTKWEDKVNKLQIIK